MDGKRYRPRGESERERRPSLLAYNCQESGARVRGGRVSSGQVALEATLLDRSCVEWNGQGPHRHQRDTGRGAEFLVRQGQRLFDGLSWREEEHLGELGVHAGDQNELPFFISRVTA